MFRNGRLSVAGRTIQHHRITEFDIPEYPENCLIMTFYLTRIKDVDIVLCIQFHVLSLPESELDILFDLLQQIFGVLFRTIVVFRGQQVHFVLDLAYLLG